MARKVTAAEYDKHREKMEALGLDPSDPVPSDEVFAEASATRAASSTAVPAPGRGGYPHAATASGTSPPTGAGVMLGDDAASWNATKKDRTVKVRAEPKKVSLQRRTIGEQVAAGRHERALARFQEQQNQWEHFSQKAAERTNRGKEHLAVNRAEEYRERLEVMELLERATPHDEKSGGHSWYHSLRGDGTRFVQVGNMFSGLYLPVRLHKDQYVHEIVRKPMLRDLVLSRVDENGNRKGPRTWRDDDYLLQRIGRHKKKMEDLMPGKLGHHEILEPEAAGVRPPGADGLGPGGRSSCASPTGRDGAGGEDLGAIEDEGDQSDYQMIADEVDKYGDAHKGPNLEASPTKLQFQAGARQLCTRSITLKNTGTAAIAFEWVRDPPQRTYQEGILPDDRTDRFACKQAKGRILPGRELTTCFSFSSATPGVFKTSWSLRTSPVLLFPIVGVDMHGVATQEDLLQEKREALQASMREQQVLHQVQELVEDIVEAVRLQQPRLPENAVDDPTVQEHLFEGANSQLGLHYTQHAWNTLQGIGRRIDAYKTRVTPPNRAGVNAQKSFAAGPAAQARPARGRVPQKRPALEPIVNPLGQPVALGAPCAKLLQDTVQELPSSTAFPIEVQRERRQIAVDLSQAVRAAKETPLERSQIWWLAYETVTDIVMSIPGKVKSTRAMYSLENWPFIAPPSEGASEKELEEHGARVAAREAKRGEEERETEWRGKLWDKIGMDCFGTRIDRFSLAAEEVLASSRIKRCGALSLRDRLQRYLNRESLESIEMGGTVLMYEADLGFLEPKSKKKAHPAEKGHAPAPATGGEASALQLDDGDDRQLAMKRLAGVATLLESSPLAVLVLVHLGTPRPDVERHDGDAAKPVRTGSDGAGEDGGDGDVPKNSEMLKGVAERMQSLPSLEPLRDLIAEVATGASSVEFVPHEVWLSDPEAFAERVRNDSAENKVFLLENMSAFPEEIGQHRLTRALMEEELQLRQQRAPAGAPPETTMSSFIRVPWASREAWAYRAFGTLLPDIFVQDAFSSAARTLTTHTGFWLGAPLRYIGPFVEAELAAFVDVLNLPFKSGEGSVEAPAAPAGADAADSGSVRAAAPLLAVVGGGGFSEHGGEEVFFRKLELLIGLARLARHESDGMSIMLGGEVAVAILSCALGVQIGVVGDYAHKVSIRSAVGEALLEILRHDKVTLRLPIDVVCEELPPPVEDHPPPPPDPKDAKKKGKNDAPPPEPTVAPVEERTRTFSLRGALQQAARSPQSLGFAGGEECFLAIDPEEGLLRLSVGQPPSAPESAYGHDASAEPPEAEGDGSAAAPAADAAGPPTDTVPAHGVPDGWMVRDIGERTIEGLRTALRRSRGVVWNGALGRMEDEHWQTGTRAFMAAVETRLSGEDEEEAEEAAASQAAGGDEDEEDEDESDEGDKSEPEPDVDFDVAVAIGTDTCSILPSLITPSLMSFVSQSGEGLLGILRGQPLPSLLACVEKSGNP